MPIDPRTGERLPYTQSRGIVDAFAGFPEGKPPGQVQVDPTEMQRYQQYGALGYLPALLGEHFNRGLQQLGQNMAGVLPSGQRAGAEVLATLFGQSGREFGMNPFGLGSQEAPQQEAPMQGPAPARNVPGTFESVRPLGSTGFGGAARGFRGTTLPQGPKLQPPQMDIGKLFDPIMAQLKEPQRIKGASKVGGIAQILGGAAEGAFRGLNQFQRGGVGSVISGAGAGASSAAQELRREEAALELQFQESTQRMNVARAGVQSQRAGAEIQLAEAVSNTANLQAQLQFNRDIQASQMSQQQVQPLGDGKVMIQSFDPNTGQGKMQVIDTVDPEQRAMQNAYIYSQILKNTRVRGRDEPKILIDGKQYARSALVGSANSELQTPLEKEAFELAIRAKDNPDILEQYSRIYEDEMKLEGSGMQMKRWELEPEHVIFDFIYQRMLMDAGERATMWQATMGQANPTAARPSRPSLSQAFGPGPSPDLNLGR